MSFEFSFTVELIAFHVQAIDIERKNHIEKRQKGSDARPMGFMFLFKLKCKMATIARFVTFNFVYLIV